MSKNQKNLKNILIDILIFIGVYVLTAFTLGLLPNFLNLSPLLMGIVVLVVAILVFLSVRKLIKK